MSTRDLSIEEAAMVARFDVAADAEESLRERVARAMYEADEAHYEETDYDFHQPVEWGYNVPAQSDYRRRADAAIAVMRGDS